MKKILLIIGMVCIAVIVSGQTKGFKTENKALNLLEKLGNAAEALNASEKLDSTINESWNSGTSLWTVSGKSKYTYQTAGNTTTVITLKRDASTGFLWVNYSRTETTVNGGGQTTLLILSSWNNILSQWIPFSKSEYTYDANGNETLFTFYTSTSGTSIPVWVASSKTESVYASNLLTLETDYKWVTSPSPGWERTIKTEYTYSGANLTKEEEYDWDKTIVDWVKSTKTEYTYSGADLIKEESSDWDKNVSTYIKTLKTEYSYTGGKMTQDISYEWDLTLPVPDWVYTEKNVYTYSGINITLVINSNWDNTITVPAWVNSSKTEASYDINGRMILFGMYMWDESVNNWDGLSKSETTYGVTDGKTYTQSVIYSGDPATTGWIKSTRSTSWYSGLNTSVISRSSENQVNVYPNPASDNISFTGISGTATVVLIDMNGSKVLEQKLTDEGVLPVAGLTKGLYIYKVSANGITRTGRVILK
jgi:hypothetical protein